MSEIDIFNNITKVKSAVIASSDSNKGLFYSEDNGKTWNQSNVDTGDFYCFIVINDTIITGSGSYKGLLYSEDNGKTWNQSNITTGDFKCLTVIDSTVIASESYRGLYYSEDNGKTWKESNITAGDFECLTVIDNIVIAGSSDYEGLIYSEDNGKTWNQSNITSDNFFCLTVIGSTVIAGSGSYDGLLYSKDKGKTWNQSNITSGCFYCLTVIGNTVISGSRSYKGLFYSEDNGKTWKRSNIDVGNFKCLTVAGNTIITGSYYGLLYSDDKGKTWKHSNINYGHTSSLIVIGNTVIANGSHNNKNYLLYSEDNGHTWRNYDYIIKDDKVNDIVDCVNDKEVCDSNMSKEIETTQKVQLIFEFDKNGDVLLNDGVCTTIEKDMTSIKFNCNGYDLAKRIALNLLESLPLVIDIVNLNNDELGKNIISFSIGFSHEYIYHKYTILITKPSIEVHIKESDKYIKWVTSVNNIILFDDFSKIVKNYSVKGDFKEYNINSKPKIVEQYYAFDDSNNIEVKHQYLLSEIINYCSNILYVYFYQKYCSK